MPRINQISITQNEFLSLIEEAKLTKSEFCALVGCKENIYYSWIKKKQIPFYVKIILDYAIEFNKIKTYSSEKLNLIEENRALKKQLAIKKENDVFLQEEKEEHLTKQEFNDLIAKCGYQSYQALANFLDIHIQTIIFWNKTNKYPKYLKQLLEWLIYIREFESNHLLNDFINNNNIKNTHFQTMETIKKENEKLKEKLENCKMMKKMLKEKLLVE
ncbi:hypothetical protein ACRBLZ_000468 [Campylobacter upsaliensis]|uniref:Bacteriophage CI repressor n=1 Tax=Campylobacter upsaliensis TaxID=28080 RepID=A0A5L8ZCR7_CAMUP|nr:hypothetical protein [Campylobacter upsaliensis]EAK0955151.1 hypothetical protein [Campylobacter upsaliensis]EAL3926216.1 hypothetical protein [Campylobacter upsaliensis]EAL8904140.1 hypothetical protein [Campylobacter upsaliensis]EBD1833921.1 hypothetical protein [Campylobacter upsaliensis]EDP6840985.1 hypothetical protein [Campylobacter upsaliensis]